VTAAKLEVVRVIAGVLGALALIGAPTGCGGDDSPTVEISSNLASPMAAEVLVDVSVLASATGAGNAMLGLQVYGTLASTPTVACSAGSIATALDGSTEQVTFDGCVDTGGTLGGDLSLKFSQDAGGALGNASATLDATVKNGAVTFALTGDYATSFNIESDSLAFELTSDSLEVEVSSLVPDDVLTLSSVDIQESLSSSAVTHPGMNDALSVSEKYRVNSGKFDGTFDVATTTPLTFQAGSQHPNAGVLTITGANDGSSNPVTTMTITIMGDETSTPPTGQGQIELDFGDTGPMYVSWAQLVALAVM
jgi:hypothetical protein